MSPTAEDVAITYVLRRDRAQNWCIDVRQGGRDVTSITFSRNRPSSGRLQRAAEAAVKLLADRKAVTP